MKKFLGLCLVLCVLPATLVQASQTYILKVKVQTANVRAEADMNASIIKTFPAGTLLESKNKIGDWYEIIIDDGKGNKISAYISAGVVDLVSGETKPAKQKVRPPVQPPVQAGQQPTYDQQEQEAAPKAYSQGGIRLLGGLTSANIIYNKNRLKEEGGDQDLEKFIESRTGLMGGIGLEMGSQISFELDVMYMPKGVKFQGQYDATSEGGGKIDFNADMVFNEVSVPVFIKIKLLRGSTPYFFGGGEVGYVLSGKMTYSYTANGETTKDEEDLLKKNEQGETTLNRIDYGMVFGAGAELNLGGLKFTIEGRYHMGLANMFKQTQSTAAKSDDYFRSKALVVLAGIKF